MFTIPNRTERTGDGEIDSNDFDLENAVGWNADVSYIDRYVKNKDAVSKLIRLANSKIPLGKIIFKYGIIFEESYSTSGWNHKTRCPFPDHDDSTPSFGFNHKTTGFKCFGCNRSGGSVQFLSYLTGRSQFQIAKELLASFTEEELIAEIEESSSDEIDKILLEFAYTTRSFLETHREPEALNFTLKATELVDYYILFHLNRGSIRIDTLRELIVKISEYLKEFDK